MFFSHGSEQLSFDQYVQLLQRMTPIRLFEVRGSDLSSTVTITGEAMVQRLVINGHRLREDISVIASEIQHWGRMVAQSHRANAVAHRKLRIWKAEQELAARESARAAGDKAPSKDTIEAIYRTAPGYGAVEELVEETQESLMAIEAIYQAFRCKDGVLEREVWRASDGSLQRRSP